MQKKLTLSERISIRALALAWLKILHGRDIPVLLPLSIVFEQIFADFLRLGGRIGLSPFCWPRCFSSEHIWAHEATLNAITGSNDTLLRWSEPWTLPKTSDHCWVAVPLDRILLLSELFGIFHNASISRIDVRCHFDHIAFELHFEQHLAVNFVFKLAQLFCCESLLLSKLIPDFTSCVLFDQFPVQFLVLAHKYIH